MSDSAVGGPDKRSDAAEDPGLAEEVRRLSRLIAALQDDAMRQVVLLERIIALGPAGALSVLAFLRACVPTRPSPEFSALETFMWILARRDGLPYGFARELYEEALTRGESDLASLLLAPPAARTLGERTLDPDPRVAEMPLGTRKQLARRPDRATVEKFLRDPEPSVIRQLLLNSVLTEDDVLSIATQRPAEPEVLREVSASPRWARRYRIKTGLCRNPFAPGEVALRILPMLRVTELRSIANDGTLHERVCEEARRLLHEKERPQ